MFVGCFVWVMVIFVIFESVGVEMIFSRYIPKKTKIDTKNDGLKNVSPFKFSGVR